MGILIKKTPLARHVYGFVTQVCVQASVRKYAVEKNAVGYLLIPLTAESKGKSKTLHTSAILQQDKTERKREGEEAEVLLIAAQRDKG